MAVQKLSQITASGSNLSGADTLVGVHTGNTDLQFTGAQVWTGMTSNPQTWTAAQTFTNSDIILLGSSTGFTTFTSDNSGASNFTLHFPAANGTLALTSAIPASANPTATASDVAVNGVATTFMTSDSAPAVQKTSSSVFGLCKVDGSTITAAAGVISAAAGVVSSVSNSDGTLTISPTTGSVVASIALGHANHWTNTTDSSSVSTGAIICDGGVGIAKQLFVGSNINLPTSTASVGTFKINTVVGISRPIASAWFLAGAGNFTVTGTNNLGLGGGAMAAVTSGGTNVGLGALSLAHITTGASNMAIGFQALTALTAGNSHTAIGVNALQMFDDPSQLYNANAGIGASALRLLTSGGGNVAIGSSAGTSVATGGSNTFVGFATGTNYTGAESGNTIIGFQLAGTLGESNTIQVGSGGTLQLDYAHTTAGRWTMAGNLTIPALSTAGVLVNDSSGNISSDSNANAATVSASFIADHRLTITIGATTYYIAMSTTAW